MRKHAFLALCLMLSACAHEQATTASTSSVCRTPMPLELRLRRIEQRIVNAYAHAPPLSVEEHGEMRRLASCTGASALGVGDGCASQWQAARDSGLVARHRMRAAQYDIPERVRSAISKPLGPERTNDLLVAMLTAEASETALQTHLRTRLSQEQIDTLQRGAVYVNEPAEVTAYQRDPLQMMLVSSDLQQAIICDAADLAAGRRQGMVHDPAAAVPDGP